MPVTVRVEGFDDASAALRRLGDNLEGGLDTAVEAGVLIIENAIKEKAPYKSGNLRRSITHQRET